MRYNLVLGCAGVATAFSLACTQSPGIPAILEVPQQFTDVEVMVSGVATDLQPDSLGNGGYYVLQYSGGGAPRNAIRVRSNYLPAPGGEYDIRGRLVLDPDSDDGPLLLETSRSGSPDWLLLVMLVGAAGGGAVFILFTGTLAASREEGDNPRAKTETVRFDLGDALADYHSRWRPMAPPPAALRSAPLATQTRTLSEPSPPQAAVPNTRKTVPFHYLGAELEVVDGPDKGRRFPVAASPLLIGRAGGRNNHVVLTDDTVSMAHATIVRDADDHSFRLINDSRTNQAWVGHSPVEECKIANGASIRLGSTVLVFHQHSTNGHSKSGRKDRAQAR